MLQDSAHFIQILHCQNNKRNNTTAARMSISNKIRPTNGQLPISMTLNSYLTKQITKQKPVIYILDFKLSPCLEYCICSFGYLPGVRLWFADVSEPSVSSIFKGWIWSILHIQHLKMELTEGSETSENHNLAPGRYPKEHIQHL